MASVILLTHSPLPLLCSQGFSLLVGKRGEKGAGRPSREGKSPGNEVESNPLLVSNYHVHNSTWYPITHSKGENMSCTRKMFRISTKRILTCLFNKKRGLFSILVQSKLNSPKVTKKVLVFQKVARSCSLRKKAAHNPKSCWKVAEQNLDKLTWEGLYPVSLVLWAWLEMYFTFKGTNSKTKHYLFSFFFRFNTLIGAARANSEGAKPL